MSCTKDEKVPDIDLSGKWIGRWNVNNSALLGNEFRYELTITQNNKIVSGTSKNTSPADNRIFANFNVEGNLEREEFNLREMLITQQVVYTGERWCYKKAKLAYSKQGSKEILQGTWNDPNCNSGTMYLEKQ